MKLIEHFEHVIRLVKRKAPYTEIELSLLGMHEELHGTQAAAANVIKLRKENAALRKSQSKEQNTRTTHGTLILTPTEQQTLDDLISIKKSAGLPYEDAADAAPNRR